MTETKGTKGTFGNPKSSLTIFNSDKTFLFKARASCDSALVGDNGRKTREDNVHNMPKDRVKIQEGYIGNDGLLLGNELGCHLSQVDGTEKKKAKSIRSPKGKKNSNPKETKSLKRSSLKPITKPYHPTPSTSSDSSSSTLHGSFQQKATNLPLLEVGNMAQEQSRSYSRRSNCSDSFSSHGYNGRDQGESVRSMDAHISNHSREREQGIWH